MSRDDAALAAAIYRTSYDLYQWIADPASRYRDETGHFIRWAVKHRPATGLTFGTVRWQGPAGPLDTEKRWSSARRLLDDDSLDTSDRFAGLLLLLYAQKIATISQLTEDHVRDNGKQTQIVFGTAPIVLPEPLADLARQLLSNRRGKAKTGASKHVPWLFPGGSPGQPIGDDALGQRLHRIGINPRLGGHAAIGVSGGFYNDSTGKVDPYGGSDAMLLVDVANPNWVSGNTVLDRARRHCVQSRDVSTATTV